MASKVKDALPSHLKKAVADPDLAAQKHHEKTQSHVVSRPFNYLPSPVFVLCFGSIARITTLPETFGLDEAASSPELDRALRSATGAQVRDGRVTGTCELSLEVL